MFGQPNLAQWATISEEACREINFGAGVGCCFWLHYPLLLKTALSVCLCHVNVTDNEELPYCSVPKMVLDASGREITVAH